MTRTQVRTVAVVAAFILTVLFVVLAKADAGFDSVLFDDTNNDRQGACGGEPAYQWSAQLAQIAQSRADYMASSGDFSHINGAPPPGVSAENIGWTSGITDPTQAAHAVNQAYLNSADHKANICDRRWGLLGIGSTYRDSWDGKSQVWIDAEEFGGSGPAPAAPHTNPNPGRAAPVPGTGGH